MAYNKGFFPAETTRFDLWTPEQVAEVGLNAPYRLAKASEQFMEWLKWPQSVQVKFLRSNPMEDWQYGTPVRLEVPHRDSLSIRIEQQQPPAALFTFNLQIMTDGKQGIVDAIDYDLARITYEDYLIPWSIAVKSLSRVLFPRRRERWPSDPSRHRLLLASLVLRNVSEKLTEIRRGDIKVVETYTIDGYSYSDPALRTTYVES